MIHLNFSKTVSLLIGVLAMTFLIVLLVSAWTEPTTSPPSGNVDEPINIGDTNQLKSGKLGVSDGLDTNYGLTVGNSTNNLGIKTDGNIQMENVVIKGDGTLSTGLNADKLDDLSSADLMAGGGGVAFELHGNNCATVPDCPVGWTDMGCASWCTGGGWSSYDGTHCFGYHAIRVCFKE